MVKQWRILALALILSLIYVYRSVYHKIELAVGSQDKPIHSHDRYVTQEQYLHESHASVESISNVIHGIKKQTKDMRHTGQKTNENGNELNVPRHTEENTFKIPINKTTNSEDYGFCRHSFVYSFKVKINANLKRLKGSENESQVVKPPPANKQQKNCSRLRYISPPGPRTALASFPGSGNTWVRHLLQQATGE